MRWYANAFSKLDELTIRSSRRARRIILTVKPSGEVVLTHPVGVSRERALRFYEERRSWVEAAQGRMAARRAEHPTEEVDVEALRRQAKADLPARLERLSRLTGLKYQGVTIRAARTKWGSCTSRNTISLSLYLMRLPEHLRDFVLLHELCHTVHHNHSPRFYALLDHFCGGRERELRRELRRHSVL